MLPVLFSYGVIKVYSYGFMLAIALVAGGAGMLISARNKGIDPDTVLDLLLVMVISAIVVARISYLPLNWSYYAAQPVKIFYIHQGGLTFPGAVLGGAAGAYFYCRRRQLKFGVIADLAAPFLSLGYALVRIGCFLNGCCYGKPASYIWAIPRSATDLIPRHPTQLYSSAAGIVILILLLWWRQKKARFDGELFTMFVIFYSGYRFVLEFFRDSPVLYLGVTPGQLVSVVAGSLAVLIWLWKRRRLASGPGGE